MRVAGLSYWARFPHVDYVIHDAAEAERALWGRVRSPSLKPGGE